MSSIIFLMCHCQVRNRAIFLRYCCKVNHDLAAPLHATSTMNLKSGGAVANTILVILLIWLLLSRLGNTN